MVVDVTEGIESTVVGTGVSALELITNAVGRTVGVEHTLG